MNQVQVQVVDLEVRQGFLAGCDDIVFTVFVVPELRRDPNFLATEFVLEKILEHLADFAFVAVNGCAIKVAITD